MRKPILIIGLFLIVATVALVYAIQAMAPDSIPLSVKKYIPRTFTHPVNNSNSNVQFEWKLANPYLLKNSSGDVYLDLRVSGKTLANVERKQMNLVLVIDRSGSMGDENKLQQVKDAAVAILNNMNATDRLSIVIYDDNIQTILPSTPVENKEQIRETIYSLYPGGGTNLCGGLQQGFQEMRNSFNKNYVNRIVLLSDGLANVGISDPEQIAMVAKNIREHSISVSTMGVGIDYNENLMANIADNSGGNYYYISKDVNMAEIFHREWNLMQKLVATDTTATLNLGNGVEVMDVAGFKWEKSAQKLTIQVPDIYSGESKRLLVHLRAPSGSLKVVDLGEGQFSCTDISGKAPQNVALNFHPTIQVIEDKHVVQKHFDREIQAKVASVEANQAMQSAYKKLEEGDRTGAYQVAAEAASQLQALGYVENKKQETRYQDLVRQLNPSAPMPEDAKKDLLKKNKEAERNSAQSSAQ